jgi:hypothetical protein
MLPEVEITLKLLLGRLDQYSLLMIVPCCNDFPVYISHTSNQPFEWIKIARCGSIRESATTGVTEPSEITLAFGNSRMALT